MFKVQGFSKVFEAEIFTILLFATSEFCNGQTQGMIIRHLVTFIKHMSVRFIKFMSCKNAERGVSSGALLLAYGNFNAKRNKIRNKYS